MKKKKIIIIVAIVIFVLMLIPIPTQIKNGDKEYNALLYHKQRLFQCITYRKILIFRTII